MTVKEKKKKEKKRRKEERHDGKKRKRSDKLHETVQVSLDTNIAAVTHASNVESSKHSASLSWGTVFAAAATIKPQELGEDFLRRTETSSTDQGLEQVSRLAQEQQQQMDSKGENAASRNEGAEHESKRAKYTDTAAEYLNDTAIGDTSEANEEVDAIDIDEVEVSLEGRMVPHPNGPEEEQVMVLVDPKRLKVYSALERTSDGDYVHVGNLIGGNIVFKDDAFLTTQDSSMDTSAKVDGSNSDQFPFPTDADDHCESPIESYKDIVIFLNEKCRQTNGGEKEALSLYDPYYCNGAVTRNLSSLGFPDVHNENKDCYKVWSTGVGYPDFHVLITNPPYSGNHVEKLLQHVTNKNFGNRPWFLLMPTWVHKKDYYKSALDVGQIRPFYLVPKKRYVYLPPKDFRDKRKSDVHKKSSPFVSMWYIWGGTMDRTNQWIELYQRTADKNVSCDLARSRSALRDLRRKGKKR